MFSRAGDKRLLGKKMSVPHIPALKLPDLVDHRYGSRSFAYSIFHVPALFDLIVACK